MSIVSGIATAPGVSSLLNAPRDVIADLRASAQEQRQVAEIRRAEATTRVPENRSPEKPLLRDLGTEAGQSPPARTSSGDSRYERFVQAVQALRGDFESLRLPEAKVAIMKASADEVFMLGDGVPGDVPKPVIGELKLIAPPPPKDAPDAVPSASDAQPVGDSGQGPVELTIPEPGFVADADVDTAASDTDQTRTAEPVFIEVPGTIPAETKAPEAPKAAVPDTAAPDIPAAPSSERVEAPPTVSVLEPA